jgi:hypothetical protein
VRLGQHILEKSELVEETRRARLQHLAAELAVECLMPLEHDHPGAALGQEQAEQQTSRAAAHHGDIGL